MSAAPGPIPLKGYYQPQLPGNMPFVEAPGEEPVKPAELIAGQPASQELGTNGQMPLQELGSER